MGGQTVSNMVMQFWHCYNCLSAKCANKDVIERIALQPIQVGVGVPEDAKDVIHATRCYTEEMPTNYITIKMDFTNAFIQQRSYIGCSCCEHTRNPSICLREVFI